MSPAALTEKMHVHRNTRLIHRFHSHVELSKTDWIHTVHIVRSKVKNDICYKYEVCSCSMQRQLFRAYCRYYSYGAVDIVCETSVLKSVLWNYSGWLLGEGIKSTSKAVYGLYLEGSYILSRGQTPARTAVLRCVKLLTFCNLIPISWVCDRRHWLWSAVVT